MTINVCQWHLCIGCTLGRVALGRVAFRWLASTLFVDVDALLGLVCSWYDAGLSCVVCEYAARWYHELKGLFGRAVCVGWV